MIFPNEAEIQYFTKPENAEFFGKLWQPQFGDFVATYYFHDIVIVVDTQGEFIGIVAPHIEDYGDQIHDTLKKYLIPIFRPDQLIKMLEERGCNWHVCKRPEAAEPEEHRYLAWVWKPKPRKGVRYMEDIWRSEDCYGPTPAIALGKAVMEVCKEDR